MAVPFDYLYFIISLADCELAAFTASLTSSVDSNQKIVAAALYIQCDFPVVVDHDGAYVQAVWRNRGDGAMVL